MYQKDCLSLDEARRAVDAVLKEAGKNLNRPMAVAVVDDRGDLVCFAKMDKAGLLLTRMAINKAYTAATFGGNTREISEHWEDNKRKGLNYEISIWGDNKLTTIGGGLAIKSASGAKLGAIGCAGLSDEDDEKMASIGLNAIKL